jgi:hypothetical protein
MLIAHLLVLCECPEGEARGIPDLASLLDELALSLLVSALRDIFGEIPEAVL